jgi:hypothetical protein
MNSVFLLIGVVFISCSEKRKSGVLYELQRSSIEDSIKIDELKSIVIKLQAEVENKQFLIEKFKNMSVTLDSFCLQQKAVKQVK